MGFSNIEHGTLIILNSGITDELNALQAYDQESDSPAAKRQRDVAKFWAEVNSLQMWLREREVQQESQDKVPADLTQLHIVTKQHKVRQMDANYKNAI